MATDKDKAEVRKKLKSGFDPLFASFLETAPADLPAHLLSANKPLQITITITQDSVSTRETRERGRNKHGICAFWPKNQIVDDC